MRIRSVQRSGSWAPFRPHVVVWKGAHVAFLAALLCAGCASTTQRSDYELAEEASRSGDWSRAASLWYDILVSRESSAEAYRETARALHNSRDSEGACATLRRGLEEYPNDPSLYELHANILVDCGFHRAAELAFARLVELSPDHVPGLVGLGRMRMRLGLERAAAASLRRAAILAPESIEPRVLLAGAHQAHGDLAGAFGWYVEAIDLGASSPDVLVAAASLATQMEVLDAFPGARAQALTWLDSVVEDYPQYTSAHFLRGAHLLALEQEGLAELSFLRAVETDPSCLPALAHLAQIYAGRADVERTREFVDRALRIEVDPLRKEELAKLLETAPTDGI